MKLIFLIVAVVCAYLLVSNPDDELTQSTLDGIAATKGECGNGQTSKNGCVVRKPLKGNAK